MKPSYTKTKQMRDENGKTPLVKFNWMRQQRMVLVIDWTRTRTEQNITEKDSKERLPVADRW